MHAQVREGGGVNYEPSQIIDEAEKAEESRDIFLASMDEMVQRSHGSAYRSDKENKANPENHEHDFISHVLAQIAFGNPRVGSKGRSGMMSRQIAKAMKYGLNRLVEDQKFFEIGQAVCLDGLFTYGVFLTTNQPVDWEKANDYESPRLPVFRRLDPKQFLMDPLCSDYRYARWLGHDSVWDCDELERLAMDPESGWDPDLVALLNDEKDEIQWRDQRLRDNAPERNECVIREIWCPGSYLPGYGPEDGFHGTIFTVARGQAQMGSEFAKDSWIRAPRPYWGPPWGMYTLFGVYRVPGLPFPLGPLCVQKPEADDLNAISRVVDQGAREYKRIYLFDGTDANSVQKVKAAKNGDYVAHRGFRPESLTQLESGGVTPEMLEILAIKRARLDRRASMSETQRGNARGSSTATAESIADQANEITVGWIRERYVKSVLQAIDTAGWYLYNDPTAKIELGEDAAAELGMQNPTFFGDPQGMTGAKIGEYRDVVEISIEADSMNMVTSAMQRQQGLEMLDRCFAMFQAMPMMPFLPWKDMGTYLSDLYNDERPAEWFEIASQATAAMTGMQALQSPPAFQYADSGSTEPQKKPQQPGMGMGGMQSPLQLVGASGQPSGFRGAPRGDGAFMALNRPMEGKAWGQAQGAVA